MSEQSLSSYRYRAGDIPAYSRRGACLALALFLPLLAAGCGQTTRAPVAAAPQVAITTDDLVGRWGLASYRNDADRARTEVAARAACSNPYVITAGTSGGVMMHLADQATPQEVFLKTASDGSVFLGPQGAPGDRADRQILSYDSGIIVARWIDPDVATRYGTMVFVRCKSAR